MREFSELKEGGERLESASGGNRATASKAMPRERESAYEFSSPSKSRTCDRRVRRKP